MSNDWNEVFGPGQKAEAQAEIEQEEGTTEEVAEPVTDIMSAIDGADTTEAVVHETEPAEESASAEEPVVEEPTAEPADTTDAPLDFDFSAMLEADVQQAGSTVNKDALSQKEKERLEPKVVPTPKPAPAKPAKPAPAPAEPEATYTHTDEEPLRIRIYGQFQDLVGLTSGTTYTIAQIKELIVANDWTEFKEPTLRLLPVEGMPNHYVLNIKGSVKGSEPTRQVPAAQYAKLAEFVIKKMPGWETQAWLGYLNVPGRSKLSLLPDKQKALFKIWQSIPGDDQIRMLAALHVSATTETHGNGAATTYVPSDTAKVVIARGV